MRPTSGPSRGLRTNGLRSLLLATSISTVGCSDSAVTDAAEDGEHTSGTGSNDEGVDTGGENTASGDGADHGTGGVGTDTDEDPDSSSHTTDPNDPDDLYRILGIAEEGDTIYVRGLQYVDDDFLSMLQHGQALVGDVSSMGEPLPVLRHRDGQTTPVHSTRSSALARVTLSNMKLENVRFTLESSERDPLAIHAITLRNLIFEDATTVPSGDILYMAPFVEVIFGETVIVTRCQFRRSSAAYGGRGVTFRFTRDSVVHGSYIGADRNLNRSWGHFKTAVNLSGYRTNAQTQNIKVVDNFVRRQPVWGDQDGSANGSADHMMYGWGYLDWHITGNRFDGWPADRAGQLKLRGGENTIVRHNRFHGGGINTKAEMAGAGPKLFKRAHLSRNFIQMTEPLAGSYTGFLQWRNGEPACSTEYEADIVFTRNTMWGGGGAGATFNATRPDRSCLSANVDFNRSAVPGAVYRNGSQSCAPHQTSNCASGSWFEHLSSVYAGDFNGDGREDLAFRVGSSWVVHRSEGDRYILDSALTETQSESATTYDHGAVVGDFSGDGVDDLLYVGRCVVPGSVPESYRDCWRVLKAEGSPVTFTPMDFGSDGLSTLSPNESALYGLTVGNFGAVAGGESPKQDIAFWTAGGWRVNLSDGSSFSSSVWNPSINNAGVETETMMLGVQAGDFDGDGFDDLVFRARCGSPAADCWRVLVSDGVGAFASRNWGNAGMNVFTSFSRHFGLFVGDRNRDGRTDLAFVAQSACGWQYLVANAAGDGFEASCSPTFDLTAVPR